MCIVFILNLNIKKFVWSQYECSPCSVVPRVTHPSASQAQLCRQVIHTSACHAQDCFAMVTSMSGCHIRSMLSHACVKFSFVQLSLFRFWAFIVEMVSSVEVFVHRSGSREVAPLINFINIDNFVKILILICENF